jgi:toxin ParE1/3/4
MKLVWTSKAVQDIASIKKYIAEDNPLAAKKIVHRIFAAAKQLIANPGIGRLGRINETRELVVSKTPYILPYQVIGNEATILRVLHAAMQWPQQL